MSRNGASAVTAIVGATVLDGNGGTPIRDGVIVVEGSRIVAVGDRSTPVPPQAERVAAAGKFVIPGLLATGMWLVDGTWPPLTIEFEGRYDEVAIEAAQIALRGGVTTVFDNWGPRDALIKARDAINAGRVTAARISVCGTWVGVTGPYAADFRPHHRPTISDVFADRIDAFWETNMGIQLTHMSPDEVRREVRAYAASGIDYLTYPVNVHRARNFQFLVFSQRVQRVIVEEAHRAGIPAHAVFATTEEGIREALDAGADILSPSSFFGKPMSPETVDRIAKSGIGVLSNTQPAEDLDWYRRNVEPVASKQRDGYSSVDLFGAAAADARALVKAGALITSTVWGGVYSDDQCVTWGRPIHPGAMAQLGEGHVRGIRALLHAGMTPMHALTAMTGNVARAFKVDKDLGTLEPGKFADLVVLDHDPLDKPENYLGISLVMKEGRAIDRTALPTQRLLTARGTAAAATV